MKTPTGLYRRSAYRIYSGYSKVVHICITLICIFFFCPTGYSYSASIPDTNEYLNAVWKNYGRQELFDWFGIDWNSSTAHYEIDPAWKGDPYNLSQNAYFAEELLRPTVYFACRTNQLTLIDELADFFNVFSNRLVTNAKLKRIQIKAGLPEDKILKSMNSNALTIPYTYGRHDGEEVNPNLDNSQFFHPVGRLINCISALPPEVITVNMRAFINTYIPIIVDDHILRLIYSEHVNNISPRQRLIDLWRMAGDPSAKNRVVKDWYLWLIATSAEILGANKHNPQLVPLSAVQARQLKRAVVTGVKMVKSRRTIYNDTRNFNGETVRSAIYFLGDNDNSPDMEYANYKGKTFPVPAQASPPKMGSWDISHSYRIPVFFKSLADNRQATGLGFPAVEDLELVINQYAYRAFQGNLKKPLFNNYLDGNNGWYRVGHHGSDHGHPPSQYFDPSNARHHSLIRGAIMAWGQLSQFHPDLKKIEQAILSLASTNDANRMAFRNRYYPRFFYINDLTGEVNYSFLLYTVLAENVN